jgi:hypothetical protein
MSRHGPRKKNQQAQSPTHNAEKKADSTPGQPPLIADIPPTPRSTADAHNGKQGAVPWWKTWRAWKRLLEIAVGLAAVGYAVITYMQWRDLGRNFEMDQRAWLGIASINTEGAAGSINSFRVGRLSLTLQNSGKTPALRLSGECCILSYAATSDPIPDYDERKKRIRDGERTNVEARIRAEPNRADEISAAWERSHSREIQAGGVIAPNTSRTISIMEGMDWENPRAPSPSVFYILGKFTYSDAFPETPRRTTKFCLMHVTGTGSTFSFCPENNWMD